MNLEQALAILTRVHTRDDRDTGFCVMMGAIPHYFDCSNADYVEAWKAIRMHLNMNVNPEPQPDDR